MGQESGRNSQRIFFLPISRGCKTISTDALTPIIGIPPIAIKIELKYAYTKSNIAGKFWAS